MTLVTALNPAMPLAATDAPDLVIRDARVLDLNTGVAAPATDLHIRQRRISRSARPATQELHADGRYVIPGLWDAHVHMSQWAMCSRWLKLAEATSAVHAAALVRAQLAVTHRPSQTDDDTVVGFGFRDSRWPDQPNLELLDEATGMIPTVLLSGDLHSVWVNSAAMARYQLTSAHLVEDEAFALTRRLNDLPEAVLDRRISEAAHDAAALGVVGIIDMEMRWTIEQWRRRLAHGFRSLCVRPAVYPQWLDQAIDEGLHTGDLLDPSGLLTMGPLKAVADGSLTARTASCCEPYQASDLGAVDPDNDRGLVNIALDDLIHLLTRASANGFECAIHAIGDRAVSQVLDAFAITGARGSVEHAQLVRPPDVQRMADLGVRASVQPAHVLDDRDAMDDLWADRAEHAFPLASLAAAGVPLAFGSDAPVSPLDPWLAISAAMTRTNPTSPTGPTSPTREPWHSEQALTLSQALLASTRGVAALVPGAEADLLLLDENPFELSSDRIAHLRPALTMLDGRVTHSKL